MEKVNLSPVIDDCKHVGRLMGKNYPVFSCLYCRSNNKMQEKTCLSNKKRNVLHSTSKLKEHMKELICTLPQEQHPVQKHKMMPRPSEKTFVKQEVQLSLADQQSLNLKASGLLLSPMYTLMMNPQNCVLILKLWYMLLLPGNI